MSDQPAMPRAAMRGAVDLSGLGQRPSPAPSSGAAPSGAPSASPSGAGGGGLGLRVDATESGFQELVLSTREVPALVVLWSSNHPETEAAVTNAVAIAAQQGGKLRVIAVDVQGNPGIAAAFGTQQIPMTAGLIAGQPVPLFAGIQPPDQLAPIVTEVLTIASQNGVTGRFDLNAEVAGPAEPPIDPRFESAFAAIEAGDYETAIATYTQLLKESPADSEAKLGLAQVKLLQRVSTVDLAQARADAANRPGDIGAQLLVADLDLVGGHVEDAFARCIDLVRRTFEEEREQVRTHLLELFEIVGPRDPRVVKARRSLMSALF